MGEIEEEHRVQKREAELSDLLSRMDFLGNPFDEMNIDEKKRHALYLFYEKVKVLREGFTYKKIETFH